MKNYTRKRENDTNYIIECRPTEYGTIEVEFADKTIYEPANVKENVQKISDAMEEQVALGLKNYQYFRTNRFLSATVTIVGAAATMVSAIAAPETISEAVATTIIGIGSLTSVAGFTSFIKTNEIVGELNKFKTRNAYQEELDNLGRYRYALTNLSEKLSGHIQTHTDPFNALYCDCFEEKDILAIHKEIERERAFAFIFDGETTKENSVENSSSKKYIKA